jgi:hypothetical protein
MQLTQDADIFDTIIVEQDPDFLRGKRKGRRKNTKFDSGTLIDHTSRNIHTQFKNRVFFFFFLESNNET